MDNTGLLRSHLITLAMSALQLSLGWGCGWIRPLSSPAMHVQTPPSVNSAPGTLALPIGEYGIFFFWAPPTISPNFLRVFYFFFVWYVYMYYHFS